LVEDRRLELLTPSVLTDAPQKKPTRSATVLLSALVVKRMVPCSSTTVLRDSSTTASPCEIG
jgi:hypothetical protein